MTSDYHYSLNWTKDDHDDFDVVAEFIFQVRASSLAGLCKVTYSSRGLVQDQYYYITMTFRTSPRYAFTFISTPHSL